MLTTKDILDYVKNNLATDIAGIEFDDSRILEIVRTVALPQFSVYVPDINELTIDPSDPRYQGDKSNEFKIVDPDGRRIISIEQIIPPLGTYVTTNHPQLGATSYNQSADFVLQAEQSHTHRLLSMYEFSYEIKPPNIIRILPSTAIVGPFTVKYSREHAPDFSSIPLAYAPPFLKMALGSVMIAMGRARTRFGSVSTPFGEIALNGDALVSDGRDLINEAKEELERTTIPFIEIDIG